MAERKSSDARLRANAKYHAKTFRSFTVNAKIPDYEFITKYCDSHNISKTKFLIGAAKYFINKNIDIDEIKDSDSL